jgi:hypothetical protein
VNAVHLSRTLFTLLHYATVEAVIAT